MPNNVHFESRHLDPNSAGFLATDRVAREMGQMGALTTSRFAPTAPGASPYEGTERARSVTRADFFAVIFDDQFDADLDTLLRVAQVQQRPTIMALPLSLKGSSIHRRLQWLVGQAVSEWHTRFAFFKDGDCMGAAASIYEAALTLQDLPRPKTAFEKLPPGNALEAF